MNMRMGMLALALVHVACAGSSSSSSSSGGASSTSSTSSSSGFYPGITVSAPVWHNDTDFAYGMLADATQAFLPISGMSQLLRVNLDGTGETVLQPVEVTRMVQDGTDIFAVVSSNGIYELQRIPKDGSAVQVLGPVSDYPSTMAVTPTLIMVSVGFSGHHLFTFPRDGSPSTERYADPNALYVLSRLVASGEDLFFTAGKDVLSLPAGQATPTVLFTIDEDFIESLAVDASDVWAASGIYMEPGVHSLFASGTIYTIPRAAGGTVHKLLSLDSGIQELVVTPDVIYFFNYGFMGAGRLVTIQRDGSAFTALGWDRGVHDVQLRGNRLIWAANSLEMPYPEGLALHVMLVDSP